MSLQDNGMTKLPWESCQKDPSQLPLLKQTLTRPCFAGYPCTISHLMRYQQAWVKLQVGAPVGTRPATSLLEVRLLT